MQLSFRRCPPPISSLLLLTCMAIGRPAVADQGPGIGYSVQSLADDYPAFFTTSVKRCLGVSALDSAGNVYIIGSAKANGGQGLPTTPGALYTAPSNTPDISSYLVKIDSGGRIVYQTYMVGTPVVYPNFGSLQPPALAADSSGNVFIVGTSRDDPGKTFVAEVDPTGSKLLYYHAFTGLDYVLRVIADAQGFVYLAGEGIGASFQVTNGALHTAGSNGNFVIKINPRLREIVYAAYIGGAGLFVGLGVDKDGNAYIAANGNIPVTNHAFQSSESGYFVAKLNSSGSALVYATYFPAYISALTVDASGSAYLTGYSYFVDPPLPITPGSYTPTAISGLQAFIAKLNPGGESLAFCASVDGEMGTSIVVDSQGVPTIAGFTASPVFPSVHPIQMGTNSIVGRSGCTYIPGDVRSVRTCGTGFISRFDAKGEHLLWSSYIGQTATTATAVLLGTDSAGNTYALAAVPGLPLPGVTRDNLAWSVIQITNDGPPPLMTYNGVVSSADFTAYPYDGGLATIFGTGLTDVEGIAAATSFPLPTEIAGTSVWVNGSPAPILAVASANGQQQINIQMPFTNPVGQTPGVCPCSGILVHSPRGYGFALDWGDPNGAYYFDRRHLWQLSRRHPGNRPRDG